jgi:DNA-binding transcriptional ArsR family regulator
MDTKKVGKTPKQNYYKLERIMKGCANHRRLEIMYMLQREPELSVIDIAHRLDVQEGTIGAHMRKLAIAGLVMKRNDSKYVRHALTDRAKIILTSYKMLV